MSDDDKRWDEVVTYQVKLESELTECGKLLGEAYQWLGFVIMDGQFIAGGQEDIIQKLMDAITAKLGTPLMNELGGEEDE